MDKRPIGIFDSGVGGLTILAEIKKQLPNENIVYLGDTANFPYGDKSKDEIINFSRNNVKRLIKENVKMIVIACGTATSQAIDTLKKEFDIPIIGIIEPTVKYIKEKKYKKIGVIATEGTIKSKAWESALKNNINDIQVINKACPMLATIAEEGRAMGEEGKRAIKEYMKPFKQNKIDKIILGCTHYPIYEKLIKEELEYDVELINTGITVANYLKFYLNEKNAQNTSRKDKEIAYLTKPEPYFKNIAKNILDFDIKIK
ncbi:MAG: glutamate racemase [Clostridia bacterium]|nr:glutamate racemase [Clostridia bacterium]